MGKESTFPTPVNISNIAQLDGNDSNISDITVNTIIDSFTSSLNDGYSDSPSVNRVSNKNDKVSCALNLPTLATYNCRSLFTKLGNVSTDILKRDIDVAFMYEILEKKENKNHQLQIETMVETDGLKYI